MPEVEEFEAHAGPTMDSMVVRRTPGISTDFLCDLILEIADKLAGSPLFPYQRAFARRIIWCVLERSQEEMTALWARQVGKSQTVAAIAGALMILLPVFARQYADDDRFCYKDPKSQAVRSYIDGFWIGIFAPKLAQAKIIFNRIKLFFRRDIARQLLSECGLSVEVNNGDTLRMSNQSFIVCSTASDQASIEGLSLHLGVLEESQDISDERATKSISPMLAASGGCLVKIGTANTRKSHFYNSIRLNMRREAQGAERNHFFVDWKEAAKYNTAYERYVRKEMLRLGERSDEFRMSYEGQFILHRGLCMSEELFINRTVIEGPFSDIQERPRFGVHYVAGIDFGKVHDSTVVTVMEVDWDHPRRVLEAFDPEEGAITVEIFGKHIVGWLEMLGDDYEAQFAQIESYLKPWRPERIALDYTGVGVAIGDRVRARFDYADVVFVSFSPQAKDSLGRQFLTDLNTGMLTWPGGLECSTRPEFKQFKIQMLDLEKEYVNGLLCLHHPELRGAHDDYCYSGMLAIEAASSRPYGGEVEDMDENIFRSRR